jgi:hypothetical protein
MIYALNIIYRSFHVKNALLVGYSLPFLSRNRSSLAIRLITDKPYLHVRLRTFSNSENPLSNIFEWPPVGQIEHYECSNTFFIMSKIENYSYPIVIDLYCYCPAVSHICTFTFFELSAWTVLE